MLDYGFKDVVSVIDLRSMSDKFLSTRMYSICCHLADIGAAGDKTKWSRTACEYLIELVFEKECFLEKKVMYTLRDVRPVLFCPSLLYHLIQTHIQCPVDVYLAF